MAASTSALDPVMISAPLKRSINPTSTSPALTATSAAITADSAGESLNAYIVGAVAQRMERDANSAPKSAAGVLPPEVEDRLE